MQLVSAQSTHLPAHSRVAVVGSGISGLAAAWLLASRHRVTVYEQAGYFGGHTHTVSVQDETGETPVDTGFIVYNRRNYPHLTALFDHLGVETQPTDMSFSASIDRGRVEYAGESLNTLYAQRTHLLSTRFQRMVWDIVRFNRSAKKLLESDAAFDGNVGDFLKRERLGEAFRDNYLLPMAAAIWSCPTSAMLEFPAVSLLRFFANHGLLDIKNRPQWRTVTGGGRAYVARLLERLGHNAHRRSGVKKVIRNQSGAEIILANGECQQFDQVVIATHADQALALLEAPDRLEQSLLGAFRYQVNRAVLHSDAALMPKRRRVWSSWNYLSDHRPGGDRAVCVTYWMNRLQRLPRLTPYLVSLNPLVEPQPELTMREMEYTHPVFDRRAMASQDHLGRLQGRGNVWFCGSYFGYGFHEDGLRSAVDVAQDFGVPTPWTSEGTVSAKSTPTEQLA